jgi:hypothetical protein
MVNGGIGGEDFQMTGAVWNAIGQALALLGALMLFRYGMPFRVWADGGEIITTNPTEENLRLDARYKLLGYIGLGLAVIGTLIQIAANFLPSN